MQVTLSRRGDYTIRALIDVARHHGRRRRKAREIAAEMEIPEPYVSQILANLVRHGLLNAVAGPDGGYSFARPPEQVTLHEAVEVAEGPIKLDSCVLRGGPCDWDNACPLHAVWANAQDALIAHLAATTFADLARTDEAIEADRYVLPANAPPHPNPRQRRGVRGTPAE